MTTQDPAHLHRGDPSPEEYDSAYYGMGDGPPKANYRGYGPGSDPHWANPLAWFIIDNLDLPVLDLGGAYGHLTKSLTQYAGPQAGITVDWSDHAHVNRVTRNHVKLDARQLRFLFREHVYGTTCSLDFLEHFEPPDTSQLIRDLFTLTRPGGYSIHLIGAHNPNEDLSRHMADPTHRNHETLAWYREQFLSAGFVSEPAVKARLDQHYAWRRTDWNGRWLAFRRPVVM